MGINLLRALVRGRAGLGWMLLVSSLVSWSATSMADQLGSLPVTDPGGVVATYRGSVSAALVEDWAKYSPGATAGADRRRHTQELLLTLALAEEARRLGLDAQNEVRHELERQRFRQLAPLLKNDVLSTVEVEESEVEKRFLEIRDSFTRPERSRLRNLFKRFPVDADSEVKKALRQEMAALRRRALEGESFARLAEEASDSQTRLQGGLLGNVRAGTFRPEVDAVAMALEAGEVSEVLETEDGLTLLYCEQKLDAVTRSDEELMEIARDQVVNTKYRRAWHELQQELSERARATSETEPSAAMEDFLVKKMTVREALSRGLHEQPGLDRRWYWKQQQVLSAKALASEIQRRLKPITEQDQRAYFETKGRDLIRPAHFRLTVLALSADEQDLRRVYQRGAEIRQSILRGEVSLEDAARRHSVDPSAKDGGQVGWVGRWQIPKRFGIDFLREMQRLEIGGLSKWVLAEGFLWLIRLDGAQAPRPMTFEEAKGRIENQIGKQRVNQLEAQIVAEWLEKLDIRFPATP